VPLFRAAVPIWLMAGGAAIELMTISLTWAIRRDAEVV